MSRNMKAANAAVFNFLDGYCQHREDPARNAGQPRWTSGPTKPEQDFLVNAKLALKMRFTLTRQAAVFLHKERSYFFLVGFDEASEFGGLEEIDLTGGTFTALISELLPRPTGSSSAVRDVIESSDQTVGGVDYKGHSLDLMRSLFPRISVFLISEISDIEAYRIVFRFCAMECAKEDLWIEQGLSAALIELCDLDSLRVPYQTLCRSIFDADPAGIFLGLYRCIEGLYAFQSARKVGTTLGVTKDWHEISILLESSLGWRPPEASSLKTLLALCDEGHFVSILSALNITLEPPPASLKDAAGRHIYKLRNALVHYRPIHHRTEYNKIEWNALCIAMTAIVRCIYEGILTKPELLEADMPT